MCPIACLAAPLSLLLDARIICPPLIKTIKTVSKCSLMQEDAKSHLLQSNHILGNEVPNNVKSHFLTLYIHM